ncbi:MULTISPECIES: DUF502 domain-containing protein [Paracoccaceae]|jgi:uncharacterized membrane protein|uniref:DUF502 domain-containing protein n=1 Tax=Rhodobacterales TaxID=204455 RepID=UPI001B0FA1FB|nr:DUF502 domain-containing protein [Boseongicola sp. H5]MBO6604798.1 DUF502 domain-containing protein [Roseicyclus sp.]MBO6626144.1 DUF502 domain-containing protein [Roseicyclus sp.]MBO6922391.1 DUF502 domain-containing protein [Roseicyclus sp.]
MQLPESSPPPRRGFFASLRGNFLTGLVVIAPIGLTAWLIWSVVGWVDGWVLPFIPTAYNPVLLIREYTGLEVDVRGLGVATFLVFTVIVGWIAKGLIGRSMIKWAESVVLSIPGVRSIYSGLKQIVETVLAQGEANFDKACLVEYPRKGIWAIAFISTNAKGEIAATNENDMVSVFLPTTPNPTSGFLLFVPRADVQILSMSVEDAAKLVISAGLVYPNGQDPSAPPEIGPAKTAGPEKTPDAAE